MPKDTVLDNVASDLAVWLDQTSTRIAAAMAPQGQSPFAAQLSETQKLQYYRDQLFNPDGTPNVQGRTAQIQRLGPQGFTQVYRAVIRTYPQLRIPSPPEGGGPPPPAPVTGQSAPMPSGPIAPDGLPTRPTGPSVAMPQGPIAPDGLPTRGT